MYPSKAQVIADNHLAINIESLHKHYFCHGREIVALDGIDLSIPAGEHVCLVGRSGSGKSTLTRMICGIEPPSKGKVELFGNDPTRLLVRNRIEYSKTIQLMRQESYLTFDPLYTIQDSLLRVVTLHQKKINQKQAKLQHIYTTMGQYEMQDLTDLLVRRPKELSGGQLQRLAFLRALLVSPKILVADEPTAMLDAITTKKMVNAFEKLPDSITLLYVTHNDYLSSAPSSKIITIQNGKRI